MTMLEIQERKEKETHTYTIPLKFITMLDIVYPEQKEKPIEYRYLHISDGWHYITKESYDQIHKELISCLL